MLVTCHPDPNPILALKSCHLKNSEIRVNFVFSGLEFRTILYLLSEKIEIENCKISGERRPIFEATTLKKMCSSPVTSGL